jgi:hypothetical protein
MRYMSKYEVNVCVAVWESYKLEIIADNEGAAKEKAIAVYNSDERPPLDDVMEDEPEVISITIINGEKLGGQIGGQK